MKFIRWPTFTRLLQAKFVFYVATAGLAMLIMGCSQGPINNEEAEKLRAEVKEMSEQLTKVQTELADVIKKTEESEIEEMVQDVRNKLDTMMSSLSDIQDKLKPKEPPRTPAGQPPGGVPPRSPGGGY